MNKYIHNIYLYYYTYTTIIIILVKLTKDIPPYLNSISILKLIIFWIPAMAILVVRGDYTMVYNCPCSTIIRSTSAIILLLLNVADMRWLMTEPTEECGNKCFYKSLPIFICWLNTRLGLLFFHHVCAPPLPRPHP